MGADVSEPDPKVLEWIIAARDHQDEEAYSELVYTFQDAVYNLCYRMLGNRVEAEDASQEAFMKAFTNLERYDTERSFKTWLLSITSNHCIDRLRKRRMKFLSLDEPLPSNLQLAISEDEPGPERTTMQNQRSEYIQQLIDDLSPDDRAGIVLKYWYDYTYAEIAEVLDTTESAIKSRLFRARQQLGDLAQTRRDRDTDANLGDSLRGTNSL